MKRSEFILLKNFINKNVYIVGGSSGIGLAAAKLFAEMGSNVFIFSRSESKLKSAVRDIKEGRLSSRQKVSYMKLDVTIPGDVKKLMKESVGSFGVPDVLINCAGRAIPHYFEEITYKLFDDTMKTNLYGTWNVIQSLYPYMKKQGGHIVNVSSMAGFIGIFGLADYTASKYSVIGLSEALRSEFKSDKINVSVLCPPDTDTPGFEEENKTKPDETKAATGGAGLLKPERVAHSLVKGIIKNKFIIIPGLNGKFVYIMKRFFPGIVEYFLNLSIKKVTFK